MTREQATKQLQIRSAKGFSTLHHLVSTTPLRSGNHDLSFPVSHGEALSEGERKEEDEGEEKEKEKEEEKKGKEEQGEDEEEEKKGEEKDKEKTEENTEEQEKAEEKEEEEEEEEERPDSKEVFFSFPSVPIFTFLNSHSSSQI